MSRSVVGVSLVMAWLACLGWLAARELRPAPEGTATRATARLAPGAAFYGVYLEGRQIGTAGFTLDTTTRGYRITEVTAFDLPVGEGRRRDVARGETLVSRSLRLESSQLTLSEAGESSALDAELRPDSTLLIRWRRGRRELDRATLPAPSGGVTVAAAASFRLAAGRMLRPRGTLESPSLDPLGRTVATERSLVGTDSVFTVADSATLDSVSGRWTAVAGDSVRAWRVERRQEGALPVVDWVDGAGRLVRRDYAFGVRLERSPFEVNYLNYQQTLREKTPGSGGMVSGLARLVDLTSTLPAQTTSQRVVLSRVDGPAWPDAVHALAGGRQRVAGDTIEIGRSAEGGADTTAPPRPRNTTPGPDGDRALLQQALFEALAGLPSGGDTVAALTRWVARAVQYVDSAGGPTGSVTVARTRRADLEGKVLLFVALADLAGYPARPVFGVDVTRDGLPGHLWAEVWRRGWEAVDPVYGQAPASTSLLRLGEGATVRPLVMVPLAGGLRVRVLR